MKYLLDTHAFLWFISGNASLSKNARQAIESVQAQSYVSIASLWEIAIKTKIGKLDIGMPFVDLKKHIAANGFDLPPIHFEHLQIITDLPLQHQDPFDRILVAQSMAESLIVITKDPHFKGYEVQTLW